MSGKIIEEKEKIECNSIYNLYLSINIFDSHLFRFD